MREILTDIMVPFKDMIGGYLMYNSGEIMARFRMLTSHQYDSFYLKFFNLISCEKSFSNITSLQNNALKVNKARSVEVYSGS